MTEPTKIGKYEIRRQIGRGAMGTVYEAFDSVIERRVAIKILSFFHSLKAELVHQHRFTSDAQLNGQIGGYIERFYNIKRIHSSLGYHSPVEFECLANA